MPASRAADYALLVLLASLWGASYTFIKIAVADIPPVTLIAARTVIAGTVLLAVMWARGITIPFDRRLWAMFAIQAVLNSVLPFTLIAWAEKTVDASLAVILNSATPIFTFLITVAITRHETVGLRQLTGVALGLVGTCLVVGAGALDGLGVEIAAQLAIVLATICYAGAAIFWRSFKGLDPMVPAAGSLVTGAAMLIPVSVIVDSPLTLAPGAEAIAALLALSVLSTALAFTIYFRLLQTLGSVGTTAQAYLRVPVGVGISIVVLGEALAPTAAVGCLCVVAGVAAMTLPPRQGLKAA